MKDWDDTQDPDVWLDQLAEWRESQRLAREQQQADRAALDAAQARVAALGQWRDRLTTAAQATQTRAAHLAALASEIIATDAAISMLHGEIQDHLEARDVATARLLAGPSTAVPITMLPLRLETSWTGQVLSVRVYPDAIGVDTHDRRLTDTEIAAGKAYWTMRGSDASAADQAWDNLVRRVGAQRAAWVAQATDPDSTAPATGRDSVWDTEVHARLLPARFAVVAYHAGEPVNLAAPDQPARYVTWGAAITDPLPMALLADPADGTWLTNLDRAVEAGTAMRIEVPAGAPAIEELVVIGVRTDAAEPADLAGLLDAHAYTGGVEVLPDAIPTNNTESTRAAHSPRRDANVAADLLTDPADLADGTAGAQLADILGLPRRRLGAFTGASAGRGAPAGAMRLLVGLATRNPMEDLIGSDWTAVWDLLPPGGPAPALRVGRQPYAVLPATAPARWQPAAGEHTALLAGLLQWWGRATGPAVDLNPAAPRMALPSPRRITRADTSELQALLLETAESIAWVDSDSAYRGLDSLVGPAESSQAPAAYLQVLAGTPVAELPAVAATLPPTLLATITLTAKRLAPDATVGAVDAALTTLAATAATATGREDLARLLSQHLDAVCRRLDAWLGAASTERLLTQRRALAADPPPAPAVGAFGYLTDVRPRTEQRSHGHIHAPSLAHAATAAVLRSGYLGQRRAAAPGQAPPLATDLSSRRVRMARSVLSAVRGGQPLGAVLGYQFERDLADANLQRYLAAFRKLTRFRTGTQLEALEETRRDKQVALNLARGELDGLRAIAARAVAPLEAATLALDKAQAALQDARAAAAPYGTLQDELTGLDARIPQLQAELDAVDAARPNPRVEDRTIQVPDL
jgi:hypothetical protein